MHRLQISLPRSQVRYLADRARREGISMAELIRRLVRREAEMTPARAPDSLWGIVGIGQEREPLIDNIPASEQPDLYIAKQATGDIGAARKRRRRHGKSRR
jgi:hypothetical protein